MSSPYSGYKESKVDWLGEVPSQWSVERLRSRATLITEKAENQTRPIALENIESWSGRLIETGTEFQNDGIAFDAGDLLFGKLRPYLAKVYAAEFAGQAVGDFHVIRPAKATDTKFLAYYLLTREIISLIDGSTYGAKMPRASWDFMREMRLAFPPLSEQIAIAAFLDCETAKIDALVEEQRRLIALMKEKRQAVISHAVTKGLNPDAPTKDSGIEWLGDVPAHWDVRRIKHVARMESGHTPDRKVQAYWEDCDIPWVSLHDTSYLKDHDYISDTAQMVNALGIANSSARILPSGVVVFSRDATIGRCAITTRAMAVSQHFIAWVCGAKVSADFLLFCLRSMAGELERLTAGATLKTIGMPDVRTLTVPVPSLTEQHAIVAHARHETKKIDALIEQVTHAHKLLQERRAALISAAVTGKIDVRQSAEVLPFPVDRARARGLIATEIIERSAHQATFGRVKFQKIAFLAEAHVGINEIEGSYTREAAGPLDRALIDEMESGAHSIAGIEREQPGGSGTTVSYRLGEQRGAHRQELADWLGAERTAKLDEMIANCASLNTKQAEAVATLYGVWNDALLEGASPTDDEIISGFLNDWHPEKREKFRSSDLPEWLGWMRRHGVVPTGSGPKTTTGRFFV